MHVLAWYVCAFAARGSHVCDMCVFVARIMRSLLRSPSGCQGGIHDIDSSGLRLPFRGPRRWFMRHRDTGPYDLLKMHGLINDRTKVMPNNNYRPQPIRTYVRSELVRGHAKKPGVFLMSRCEFIRTGFHEYNHLKFDTRSIICIITAWQAFKIQLRVRFVVHLIFSGTIFAGRKRLIN